MNSADQRPPDESTAIPDKIRVCGGSFLGQMARDVVFFSLFYAYLWRIVGLHLLFHGAGQITHFPSFYTTWEFFVQHVSVPGGPAGYLAAFLSQLFHTSWLGALVVTIQAWMLGVCITHMLRTATQRSGWAIRYVPALLLLVVYGRYLYFFPTTVSLSLALALGCVHERISRGRSQAWALASFLTLSLICYHTAAGAVLLFGLICSIYELSQNDRRRLSLICAPITLALPYLLGVWAFGAETVHAYFDLLPVAPELLHSPTRRQGVEIVYALFLLGPTAILAGMLITVARAQLSRLLQRRRSSRPSSPPGRLRRLCDALGSRILSARICLWLAQTIALVAIAAMVAHRTLDTRKRALFGIDYCACHRMWPAILTEGRKYFDDPLVMHAVNRALYHTGQLGNEMFQWPQHSGSLFLTNAKAKRSLWANADVYLELGLINAAEFALTESMEGLGERPMILQRLALINMVKGNLGTARVYLGALDRTLSHHAWASKYLEFLEQDAELTTIAEVQHLRSIALDHDFLSVIPATPQMLQRLLERNPRNRMAFEYLMASHLLNGRLTTFTKRVPQFKEMGYPALPTHFEEAVLTYVYGTRKPLYLGGYEPRADLREQIEDFLGILTRHRGNRQAALAELASKYRKTYIFYYVYTQSDKAKQRMRRQSAQ